MIYKNVNNLDITVQNLNNRNILGCAQIKAGRQTIPL